MKVLDLTDNEVVLDKIKKFKEIEEERLKFLTSDNCDNEEFKRLQNETFNRMLSLCYELKALYELWEKYKLENK